MQRIALIALSISILATASSALAQECQEVTPTSGQYCYSQTSPGAGYTQVKCGERGDTGQYSCAWNYVGGATSARDQLDLQQQQVGMALGVRARVIGQDLGARQIVMNQDVSYREAMLSQDDHYAAKAMKRSVGAAILLGVADAAICNASKPCRNGYSSGGLLGGRGFGGSLIPSGAFSMSGPGDQPSRGGQFTRPQ